LAIGDVILEIDSRIATSDFEQRLAELHPGDKLHLRVRNARGEHDLHWKLASQQEVELQLVDSDNVTSQQKARRAAWLRGDSEKSGESLP
jgi:predicted metalloprotease with PDZ domain